MESLTLKEAKELDFVGAPEVHKNPINCLETVRYQINNPDDENPIRCEWSKPYVLVK